MDNEEPDYDPISSAYLEPNNKKKKDEDSSDFDSNSLEASDEQSQERGNDFEENVY